MKARVESFVLWHDESGSAMGGCHAAVGRRSGRRIIRTRLGTATVGSNALNATAVGVARSDHSGGRRGRGCPAECQEPRRLAEDSAPLARAMARSARETVRGRAVGRRATARGTAHIYAGANLRDRCDDLRDAGREWKAHQPMEPTRDCRRGDAPRACPVRLAALGGAFFKKEADLKPHRFRYWLTPKPTPRSRPSASISARCTKLRLMPMTAIAPCRSTRRPASRPWSASHRGCPWCRARSNAASSNIVATALKP